jgi:hypothetical protein
MDLVMKITFLTGYTLEPTFIPEMAETAFAFLTSGVAVERGLGEGDSSGI